MGAPQNGWDMLDWLALIRIVRLYPPGSDNFWTLYLGIVRSLSRVHQFSFLPSETGRFTSKHSYPATPQNAIMPSYTHIDNSVTGGRGVNEGKRERE